MNQVLIYGVPDSGKTTISKALQDKTGIPLIEGDYIRPYPATKFVWRKYGSLTKENTVKGLLYVRDYMRKDVDRVLVEYDKVILEAVFIDPVPYLNEAKVFLLVCLDEGTHKKQFFEHRKETDESKQNFTAVRMMQEYLLEEAQKLNVKIIYNNDTQELVVERLVNELK
jgi:2-phosphoglycerate kinase